MSRAHAVALAFLLTLAALELLLRLVPPPRLAANWLYDPVLGHRGPRKETVSLVSLEGGTYYNNHGFRAGGDPDLSPGRRNVFVIGDSITEAVQVPWNESFASLLEASLPSPPGRKTQVVPWASSDYGTAEELIVYATEARRIPHDVVALQFLGLNDFVNNTLAFAERNRAMSDFARPYLVPANGRGTVVEFDILGDGTKFTYLHPRWKWVREHLRLAAYADFVWHGIEWYDRLATTNGARPGDCPIESQVFLDDGGPEWREAGEATLGLARALRRQVDSQRPAPRLLAFYVPSFFELFDDDWNAGLVLDLTRCNRGSYHRDNPEKRFLSLFREAGIEAVSLKEDLQKSRLSKAQLYLPDGHFTKEGHRVVAAALRRIISGPEPRASSRQR